MAKIIATGNTIKIISTTGQKVEDLSQISIDNGSIYFTGDNRSLYYDYNGERLKITDVLVVKTNEDINNMMSNPIPYKFYYVEESHELFFKGNDNLWHNVFPAQVSNDFGTY